VCEAHFATKGEMGSAFLYGAVPVASSFEARRGRAPQGAGDLSMSKTPSFAAGRDHLPPGGVTLVSDEAPEATCLRCLCGSFRRLVRRLFPLHASLWQGGDGPRVRPEDDRARVRLRHHPEMTLQPGRWPGRFPPDGAPFRPGPSPGGCGPGHFRPRSSSPPFYTPRRLGSSRRHGRLVCVPLRHVLPIGVSGVGHPTPSPSYPAPRPEGDRCSGPEVCTCESARPRRRPRLA